MLKRIKKAMGMDSTQPCDIFGACEAVYNRVILQGPIVEEKANSLNHKLNRLNSMNVQSINKG